MYYPITSWAKNILLAVAALFFFIFGVDLLVASYSLDNPLVFIGAFFASCLIILIALAGLIRCGFIIKQFLQKADK